MSVRYCKIICNKEIRFVGGVLLFVRRDLHAVMHRLIDKSIVSC